MTGLFKAEVSPPTPRGWYLCAVLLALLSAVGARVAWIIGHIFVPGGAILVAIIVIASLTFFLSALAALFKALRIRSQDTVEAHKRSSLHRADVEASSICGCFYCLAIFPPSAITEWVDNGETALCPGCGIDSVVGSLSGLSITAEFRRLLHERWF